MFGPCLYAMLSINSSFATNLLRKKRAGLLNFNSFPDVLLLLLFYGAFSW